jgi:DNA-binding CsgD family transcriptional regulator
LNSGYVKGKAYCEEALQVATESGHAGQTAHALSLLALCAFFQGEYAACADYAQRSMSINETIRPGVFQPYNQSLLILLACLDEDYVEGLRIGELGKRLTIDKMGFQLLYWSLAGLSAGLGRPVEVRDHLEKLLQVSAPEVNSVTTVWIVPATAYMLAKTYPERAVELLAWVFAYDDLALNWVRPWSAFERLQTHLQAVLGLDAYETHWEKGQSLSLNTVKNYLQLAFSAESALFTASAETATPPILTARELEILHLLAAGLTNPQIAAELVIGAGTVKTHTLSIYRKLDVANRSMAIIRAQALGLLTEV